MRIWLGLVAALVIAESASAVTTLTYVPSDNSEGDHLDVVKTVPHLGAPYSRAGVYHHLFIFEEPTTTPLRGEITTIPWKNYYTRSGHNLWGSDILASATFLIPAGTTSYNYDLTIGYPTLEAGPLGVDRAWYFIRTTRFIHRPFLRADDGSSTPTYSLGVTADFSAPYRPAVPEPSTWALMIVGFGIAGAALRRQTKPRSSPLRTS